MVVTEQCQESRARRGQQRGDPEVTKPHQSETEALGQLEHRMLILNANQMANNTGLFGICMCIKVEI
jgi:hypothetical protein